jgi:hypothetical protein
MELTTACIDKIVSAAQMADNGKLVITIQERPEDKQCFDVKCEYEQRFRVYRDGKNAVSTKSNERIFEVRGKGYRA